MATEYQQYCPISKAVEVLGERWTLLVVRELLVGSRKFNDIARGVPGMSRTMLTKRLRQLEASGLVERLDGEYLPADACEDLRPALIGLGHWAAKWILTDPTAEECDVLLLMWWAHSRFDTSQLPDNRRTVIMFHFTDVSERFWVVVEPSGTSICLSDPGFDIDAVVSTQAPTLHKIWYGRDTISNAVKSGSLQFEGKQAITRRLPAVLSIDPASGFLGPGANAPAPRIYQRSL